MRPSIGSIGNLQPVRPATDPQDAVLREIDAARRVRDRSGAGRLA